MIAQLIYQLKSSYSYTRWLLALRLRRLTLRSDNWVLSRTACLGNDSFELLNVNCKTYRLNLQKVRSDFQLIHLNRKNHALSASRHIASPDIVRLIWMSQHVNIENLPKPKYILFDSFSDLTDVLFIDSKTGTSLFCHKSDLTQSAIISNRLTNEGLLPLEDISSLYRNLFQSFRTLWGEEIYILFIHYPTKLETRDYLNERAELIEIAIDSLASFDLQLFSIKVPESLVKPDGGLSEFPYHYSIETYHFIARKVQEILSTKI